MDKSLPHRYDACRFDFLLASDRVSESSETKTRRQLVFTPLRANRINKVHKRIRALFV